MTLRFSLLLLNNSKRKTKIFTEKEIQQSSIRKDRQFQLLLFKNISKLEKNLQKLGGMTKTRPWESDDEGDFITFDFLFSKLVQTKI